MTFIQRMRNEKDYRIKVVLMAVIILVIIGNTGETKKEAAVLQAICDVANTHKNGCSIEREGIIGGDNIDCMPRTVLGAPTASSKELCTANLCKVGMLSVIGFNTYVCWSLVPDGWRTNAPADENCKNDNTLIDVNANYGYLCQSHPPGVDPSTRECNAAMTGIAKVIQDIAPDLNLGCRNAFYITIFGGALIMMMMFAAM